MDVLQKFLFTSHYESVLRQPDLRGHPDPIPDGAQYSGVLYALPLRHACVLDRPLVEHADLGPEGWRYR